MKSKVKNQVSMQFSVSLFYSSLLLVLSQRWNLNTIFICTCSHINTSITEKPCIKFAWRCLMSTAAHQPCTKAFISNEYNTAVDLGPLPFTHILTLSFVPPLNTTNYYFLTSNWTRKSWGLLRCFFVLFCFSVFHLVIFVFRDKKKKWSVNRTY